MTWLVYAATRPVNAHSGVYRDQFALLCLTILSFNLLERTSQVEAIIDEVMHFHVVTALEVTVNQTIKQSVLTIKDKPLRRVAEESSRALEVLFAMFDVVEMRDGLRGD